MDDNCEISDSSLNIESKFPSNILRMPGCTEANERNLIRNFNACNHSQELEMKKNQRSQSVKSPDKRKRKLTFDNSVKQRRKNETSPKPRGRNSMLGSLMPSFANVFRILKFFKKWLYYRSYKNLQSHHLRFINDKSVVLPKDVKSSKNFISIWQNTEKNKKRFAFRESIFNVIIGFTIYLLKKSLIKDFFERSSKLIGTLPCFNPNHIFKILWDLILFVVLFLKLIWYSIERGFDFDLLDPSTYDLCTMSIAFLLLIDILLTFNTVIYKSGNAVKNRKAIFLNYITRYSIFDFSACFGLAMNYGDESKIYRDFNFCLLLKILFCNAELASRIRKLIIKAEGTTEALYDLICLGASLLLSGHIIACLWHFISYTHSRVNPDENSWLKERGILDKDWKIKYLHSIYWSVTTMLTVGYGDITPRNEDEVVFNILAMLFGCIIFGYSLNRIGEILIRRSKIANANKEKLKILHNMARGMNLSDDLETKITKYMEYFWEQEKKVNPSDEQLIMSHLSSSLREEIYKETNVKCLSSIPGLRKIFSHRTLFNLAQCLKKIRCPPEEYIYKDGSLTDSSLYIVLDGKVELIKVGANSKLNKISSLEFHVKNDYFGIYGLFTDFKRREGALSRDFCTLFQLTRQDFLSIIKQDPEEYEKFCKAKDDLILYENQYVFEAKCKSCGRVDHVTLDCPFLSYSPNKLFLIGRYQHKRKMFMKNFKRSRKKNNNALTNINHLNDNLEELKEDMIDDDDFIEMKELYEGSISLEADSPSQVSDVEKKSSGSPSNSGSPINSVSHRGLVRTKIQTEEGFPDDRQLGRGITMLKVNNVDHNEIRNNHVIQNHMKPKTISNCNTTTRSYSKISRIDKQDIFLKFEKMKNFKYYYPKSNSENVILKLLPKLNNKTLNNIFFDE